MARRRDTARVGGEHREFFVVAAIAHVAVAIAVLIAAVVRVDVDEGGGHEHVEAGRGALCGNGRRKLCALLRLIVVQLVPRALAMIGALVAERAAAVACGRRVHRCRDARSPMLVLVVVAVPQVSIRAGARRGLGTRRPNRGGLVWDSQPCASLGATIRARSLMPRSPSLHLART